MSVTAPNVRERAAAASGEYDERYASSARRTTSAMVTPSTLASSSMRSRCCSVRYTWVRVADIQHNIQHSNVEESRRRVLGHRGDWAPEEGGFVPAPVRLVGRGACRCHACRHSCGFGLDGSSGAPKAQPSRPPSGSARGGPNGSGTLIPPAYAPQRSECRLWHGDEASVAHVLANTNSRSWTTIGLPTATSARRSTPAGWSYRGLGRWIGGYVPVRSGCSHLARLQSASDWQTTCR